MTTDTAGAPGSAAAVLADEDVDALLAAIDAAADRVGYSSLTAAADRDARFPWPVWESLRALGVPGLEVPVDAGGLRASTAATCRVVERLGMHSIAASTAFFTFSGFGAHLLAPLPADHPLRGLLPGLGEGTVRVCLSLTEPGGGSDLSALRTSLTRRGPGWRLSGAKLYTTLAGQSTHVVVGCLTPGAGPWTERFALAVLPADAPGLTARRIDTQTLRTCPTYEVVYDDVEVPDDAVLAPPEGFAALRGVLNAERLAVGAQSCGLAAAALGLARDQALLREIGGGPLYDKQTVRHALVDRWQDLCAARALLRSAAVAVDAGDPDGVLPTMAQRCAASAAHAAADLAVQVHGGMGLMTESATQRLWRDTRLHLIGPIAREASADYLGRRLRATPDLPSGGR